MERIEDQFKDAFDHFEPEVDAKVWQNISRQLPSAPQVNPGASTGKGLLAKLGVKGLAAILAAGTITVSVILWSSKQPEKTAPVIESQEIPSTESTNTTEVENTTEKTSASLENAASRQNLSIEPQNKPLTKEHGDVESNRLPDNSSPSANALTGDNTSGKGESKIAADSPKPRVDVKSESASANGTSNHPTAAPANNPTSSLVQPTEESPVLILSTKGGFAPLVVTAMTNQTGKNADFEFGDGASQINAPSATHTYTEPGSYVIRCVVNGKNIEQKIQVIGQIPSAFSPNNDGVNDLFVIDDQDGTTIEIRIFNRFGKLIYKNKGNNISWDGHTIDGQLADPGTYLYDIFATLESGTSYKQKGTIQLFR